MGICGAVSGYQPAEAKPPCNLRYAEGAVSQARGGCPEAYIFVRSGYAFDLLARYTLETSVLFYGARSTAPNDGVKNKSTKQRTVEGKYRVAPRPTIPEKCKLY